MVSTPSAFAAWSFATTLLTNVGRPPKNSGHISKNPAELAHMCSCGKVKPS
jgi:hypothetical protein